MLPNFRILAHLTNAKHNILHVLFYELDYEYFICLKAIYIFFLQNECSYSLPIFLVADPFQV